MKSPLIELVSVSKTINGIPILQDINAAFYPGEFCAILGENGAGKSSFIKVLSGIYRKSSGTILIDGKPVEINTPAAAAAHGIASLQQDSMVFDHLSIADNIFIRNAPKKAFIIRNKRKTNLMAQQILDELAFPLISSRKASNLDLAQKRMVEIARIVAMNNPRVIILDEPVASISEHESSTLFHFLNQYTKSGGLVIYVTQNYHDISESADRVVIIRDGRLVNSLPIGSVTADKVEKLVWGQYYPEKYPKLSIQPGKEVFCVENLSTENLLRNISFSLNQGEILGVTGLVGSGRSQLAKTLFGLHPATSGTFYVDRLKTKIASPVDAIKLGLAYVTEDRCRDGLFMNLGSMQNVFVLENILRKSFLLNKKYDPPLYEKFVKYIDRLNIGAETNGKNLYGLSGGTHQKLLLLRWFLSRAKIFIMDEPTRGVDIASKVDIYNLMNDLIRKKSAIILISSSFDELVGMCDRILVLKDGMISYEAHRNRPNDYDNLYQFAIKQ